MATILVLDAKNGAGIMANLMSSHHVEIADSFKGASKELQNPNYDMLVLGWEGFDPNHLKTSEHHKENKLIGFIKQIREKGFNGIIIRVVEMKRDDTSDDDYNRLAWKSESPHVHSVLEACQVHTVLKNGSMDKSPRSPGWMSVLKKTIDECLANRIATNSMAAFSPASSALLQHLTSPTRKHSNPIVAYVRQLVNRFVQ